MNRTLQKTIIDFLFDNLDDFNIVNNTTKEFRLYIYDQQGDYLIGGPAVSNFITKAVKLIRDGE